MNRIAKVLLIGILLGLVASQSLMDLMFGLVTLFGLYLLVRNRGKQFDNHFPSWLYLAVPWFLWIIAGFYFNAASEAPLSKGLGDFLWLAQLPLLSLLWSEVEPKKDLVKPYLIILFLAGVYAVAIYFLGFDPLHENWESRTANLANFWRTGGLFSNPMPLAHSYGPLALTLLPLAIYHLKNKGPARFIIPLIFSTLILAVLFTFTRGVWIALALATVIGAFVFNKRLGLFTIAATVFCGGLMMVAWPKFRERTLLVFDSQKSYDSERVVLWKTNWKIFLQNPILGIGYGENKRRLREFYDLYGVPQNQFEGHAHNQYLHFLAGTGFMGLLFYLLWCGLFLRLTLQLYRNYSKNNQSELRLLMLGLLMAQVAFHLGSLTESNFTISKNRMLIVFLWSFLLYLDRPKRNTSTI